MNILDAAYHTVHDYKGGANTLAPRMGIKSPAVLNSKVNPNTDTHHLTLVEASKLMALTNDYRILQSLNAQHGKVGINLPDIPECRDTALTDLVLSFGMKGGNVYTLFKEMMADGRITRGEAIDMSKVIHRLHEILAELDAQIHQCVDDK
ncbi:phage regulatory CII family protein [Acinetobacter johnsonii]|uniref:Phage regulatory CII family protein n=1 Tax=Acinetobacter johnsonii TaxID=40214 RepID=A0AA42LJ36_ACIJO|nr:phage regulatory CII family protein [Acinetobacter johnsonii]MDH0657328.1 phage regulatory CII family protein [Acinetobacter johnsonii]QQT57222.1 phage regulatory CII family protein [Acinetobacter johnsonii]